MFTVIREQVQFYEASNIWLLQIFRYVIKLTSVQSFCLVKNSVIFGPIYVSKKIRIKINNNKKNLWNLIYAFLNKGKSQEIYLAHFNLSIKVSQNSLPHLK